MKKPIPVLLIEDEAFARKALRCSLKSHGFRVHLAKDGTEGLRLARQIRPALILLDWMMPEMDGMEVLSELKHNRKTRQIPVFMLTAKGMIGDLDHAFEMGVDDYVTKPLDLMRLGGMVKAKWERLTSPATVC